MARSTLNTTGEGKAGVGKGHRTEALGPSDSSDSGSDIVGGPGLNRQDDGLPLQHGTTSDPDQDRKGATAGPDIGDADLDTDSDRYGTGERAAAGRDSAEPVDKTLSENADEAQSIESIESLSEHDAEADAIESVQESLPEREADDVESDDRPDEEMEAIESIEKRRGLNGVVRPRRV